VKGWCGITFSSLPLSYAQKFYINNQLITDLVIPDDVTSIGESAFSSYAGLTSVTIPNSVTSIGENAFSKCTNLASVTIGNGVTSIGTNAFYNCGSLTSVTIPDSVTSIGGDAFYGCSSLTSVTIGNGVTSIGTNAFYNCGNISYVYYTGDVAGWCNILFNIGANPLNSSFLYINNQLLIDLVIPNSITSIGNNAFSGCISITKVTIPRSVTSIGSYAFSNCSRLIEVYNCSTLSITKGSTTNGSVAYNALNVYTSSSGESKLHMVDDYIFYEDGDTVYLIGYVGNQTKLTLPNKYNNKNYEIYKYAFNGYSSLTSVTIPDSITSIGGSAFSGCSSLTSITIPESVTYISGGAFYGCSGLTSITLPFVGDSIKSVSDYRQYPFGYIFGSGSYPG
jgi:hypothetical protein